MRAAKGGSHKQGGEHISGAERIITEEEIDYHVSQLIKRARRHSQGEADYINLNLELLDMAEIEELSSLPIKTIQTTDCLESRREAKRLLLELGINKEVVTKALDLLATGPSPERNNMRGAILMDASTGQRLEPDQYRGIRASKIDYTRQTRNKLLQLLKEKDLNRTHLPDALALATKVVSNSQIIAELCWSDDPGYTGGYVASQKLGYCRWPVLKARGSNRGGRVFFLKLSTQLKKVITYLEECPVLINSLDSRIRSCNSIEEILNIRGETDGKVE
jgi:6-carboxyhexanoate--CoA ligase